MNIGPQPRVYPAVYSGVGVYECMIRGIAVMRRRADSYVNATQILKVAGIDKGRRTKILEKEILPGKHEIVQGGYGKYQGTWIPLERGRDVATQYGVAPLLAPLFDHVPNPGMLGSMPPQLGQPMRGPGGVTPLHFPHMRAAPPYMIHYMPPNMMHGRPPMFPPGTPMYPPYQQMPPGPGGQPRLTPMYGPPPMPSSLQPVTPQAINSIPSASSALVAKPPVADQQPDGQSTSQPNLKRPREDVDPEPLLSQGTDITMVNGDDDILIDATEPPPFKKARTDNGPANGVSGDMMLPDVPVLASPLSTIDPRALSTFFPQTTILSTSLEPTDEELISRSSVIPTGNRIQTRDAVRRSIKRVALYSALQIDEPEIVIRLLLEQTQEPMLAAADVNAVIDERGHTALHIAAALGKLSVVEALLAQGADVFRGNYNGETPLMRAVLTTTHYQAQSFESLLRLLRKSIRTKDQADKTVLHHLAHVAGVLGRVPESNYYMETILMWVGKYQSGNFSSLVDLKDENGDTALNIAARLGAKALAQTLLAVGASPDTTNKFGLKPVHYGIFDEPQSPDKPQTPQKQTQPSPSSKTTEEVLDDMTRLIKSIAHDIASEKKAKETECQDLQTKLTLATKTLAEKRRALHELRSQSDELDQINHRITNLEAVRDRPDPIDWTGRIPKCESPEKSGVSPSFFHRARLSIRNPNAESESGSEATMDFESSLPSSNSIESIILLRRMKLWHERVYSLLDQHLTSLKGLSAEKELQMKKVIALCTGFSDKEVEERVDSLLQSMESEPQDPGQLRLAAFMDKAKPITV